MTVTYNIPIVLIISLILAGCAGKGNVEVTDDADTTPLELSPPEFKSKLSATPNAVLIDVRNPEEVAEGMIEGAINIDYTDSGFIEKVGALDKTKPYFVYCKSGKRSAGAADEMDKLGFESVYVLKEGTNNWLNHGLEMVKPQ